MEGEALPEHIGPYRVIGRLGRGGMGEVLRGHDDRLDRPIALKRIRPGGRDPEKARQRFRREAQIVARLNHPAIVQVYDWEEASGDDWLIMELVDGRPLDDLLQDGPLPPKRAATIAREIASGLAVAHEAGLVHRDLKAANVMVTAGSGHSEIKILDFGIAKKISLDPLPSEGEAPPTTLTEAGQVIGTVRSMSPEQALGYPVDHRSDLFSLGTLLYEMLSGVSPFEGGSKVETLSRICSAREAPLSDLAPDLPAVLTQLVGRLLEKQPERRPTDAREVMVEIDRLTVSSSDSGTAPPRAVIEPGVARPEDATLEMELRNLRPTAQTLPTTADNRSTYATPAISPRWRTALTAVFLLLLSLMGISIWIKSRDHETSNLAARGLAARAPAEELTNYELYHRGMTYLDRFDQEGNLARAIDDFQRILVKDESSAPALAGLSTAYRLDYAEGGRDPQRLEQALTVGRQAVQADEHLATARVSLGMAYLTKGLIEESTRELEKALEIEPLNGEGWWGLAEAAEMRGDFTQAKEHFLRAIEVEPDNWLFHSHLGEFFYHRERYQESESAFLRHAELTPDSYIPSRNLGAVYYMQGRLNEAATEFQKSLQIKPDSTTYSNLGTVQFARGLYAQAVSAFEKAVSSGGSTDYLLWGNLGDACRWTPDHESRAMEAYQLAIQLLKDEMQRRPEDTDLHTFLPLYLAKLGDCSRAMSVISDAIDTSHEQGGAGRFRIAVALEVCDQRDKALAALETALQAGYSLEDILADPELSELRQDARYQRIRIDLKTKHQIEE